MKIFNIILISIFVLSILWYCIAKPMFNPYKVYIFVGKTGSGKSTLISKRARKYLNDGFTVYTNNDDIKWNGVKLIDNPLEIGKEEPDKKSAFLIDEASFWFTNRNFKSTPQEFLKEIRSSRHNQCIFEFYSQDYLLDKQLRVNAHRVYLIRSYFTIFSVARQLTKDWAISNSAMDADDQLVDKMTFVPIVVPGSTIFTYIPKWVNYFDSFKNLQGSRPSLRFRLVGDGFDPKVNVTFNNLKITYRNVKRRIRKDRNLF